MNKFMKHTLLFSSIICCIGLSACNDNDDKKEEKYKKQANTELNNLSKTLVWNNQCQQTYEEVIRQSKKAQESLQNLKNNGSKNDNNLIQFIDERLLPHLMQLNEESEAIIKRCTSPDYDATGVSIERPDMLREMLNEWRGTLDLLSKQLNQLPNLNPNIQPADLTGIAINGATSPLTEFKDCKEDFCPEMVVIPQGEFLMGGTEQEHTQQNVPEQSRPWELPQHKVTIEKPFAISKFETTLAQFQTFQKETGWEVKGCRNWEVRDGAFSMYYRDDLNPSNVGFKQTQNDPVLCVRREDGREFAKWLSKKTGQSYRLPTEVEFEYSLRAGTTTPFYWGEDLAQDQACKFANVLDESTVGAIPQVKDWTTFNCSDSYAYSAPVGQFIPNDFGLYDMSANAREWVDDCWHENYVGAPSTNTKWGKENDGECHFPVLRGGAWIYNVPNVRSAYRNAYLSSQARSNMWGFRVVRDL